MRGGSGRVARRVDARDEVSGLKQKKWRGASVARWDCVPQSNRQRLGLETLRTRTSNNTSRLLH